MTTTIKTYSQLRSLPTYLERFHYLSLKGRVGRETFGFDRWINQAFYKSREWQQVREQVIVRDLGCDLGIEGREIHSGLLVHHMNPITAEHIQNDDPSILDPDQLVVVTLRSHNAIHYGTEDLLPRDPVERKPGDTKLW